MQVSTLSQIRSQGRLVRTPAFLAARSNKRRTLMVTAVLGLLALALPHPGEAQPSPARAPVAASADAGLVTIESDTQQADNRTGVVTAIGNVRIQYPDRHMVATSRQAQYFSKEGRLVLTGDVDVIDADGQRIRAERLVYRLDSERLLAEPSNGKQVYSRLRLQNQSPAVEAKPLLP
jgi:lipopolysaccharide export system protein LptA